ncbi:MAG: hypothetical protein IPH45_20940 [Bacteroidales bacterium]|nr:hypothetical protein [Bacteroidales bacterium]
MEPVILFNDVPQAALFAGQFNRTLLHSSLNKMKPQLRRSRAGWNLIGNPFTSAIQWDGMVTRCGVDGAVYVWNGATSILQCRDLADLPGGIIPLMNGFMVKQCCRWSFVIIPFAARVHSNMPFYKESITKPDFTQR